MEQCKIKLFQVTTPPSMVFDEKSRKSPSPTLINRPTTRLTTTIKPKTKTDIVEPEIDIDNVPVLQGSFEVTKTDADLTEKKVRTSTLKPFTITNGGVRMKPKKPTIEKVRPLAKVPENPTANILKLDNVTRAPQANRITTTKVAAPTAQEILTPPTTNAPPTTTPFTTPTTFVDMESRSNAQYSTSATKSPGSSSFAWSTTESVFAVYSSPKEATSQMASIENDNGSTAAATTATTHTLTRVTSLEGEFLREDDTPTNKEIPANAFPSQIVLDNQPWQPIQPNLKPINYSINDAKKKINNPAIEAAPSPPSPSVAVAAAGGAGAVVPPMAPSNYDQNTGGFQALPRNKLRTPITPAIKPKIPTVYQSFNPGLMYGFHEVERLGNGAPKPYPLPVDLIGDQLNYKKDDSLVLNKGEILPIERDSLISITSNASSIPVLSANTTEKAITLNLQETTEKSRNKTDLNADEQVGEILLDLLKESNMKINASAAHETIQSRTDDTDILAEAPVPLQQNETHQSNEPEVDDHTEALEEIATVLTSIETLSFKNIKDYIMATTKSIAKEAFSTTTERDQTSARRGEKPQTHLDSMIKSDRIALPAPISPMNRDQSSSTATSTPTPTTTTVVYTDDIRTEPVTTAFVEVDTVEYTPGTSWNAALFPVQSKWEYANGSLVYPSPPPMRKIFNETLQAWIIENPAETTENNPIAFVKNNTDSLKNISAIFDTLASNLALNAMSGPKLTATIYSSTTPTPKAPNKPASNAQPTTAADIVSAPRNPVQATSPAPPPPPSSTMADDELPILLNQNTESFYSSSAETFLGQAEVEEVDPTQYEQMLLIDRVSSALRSTSTIPPLITLMPVKSNSGIRHPTNNDKWKNSGRGFPPARSAVASSSSSNKRPFQDTSFIVRTNINVGS